MVEHGIIIILYLLTEKIIAERLTKKFVYVKIKIFIEQMTLPKNQL